MTRDGTLRVGIVGTNFISDWFCEAAGRTHGAVTPIAVYSRTAARAQEFALRHGLAHGVDTFDALLEHVDAVYIASPTMAHHGQALAAIDAGKHVLVEKTMATTLAEVQEIFAAAEAHGVIAMEATRHLHLPAYRVLKDAVSQLGPLRYAHFGMLQYSSRYDRFRAGEYMNAFDPALGNSALADIGVYCLEPALDLFGVPPSHSGSSVRLANGFEALGSIQLDYGSMIADIVYAKIAQGAGPSVVVGESGSVSIDSLAEPAVITLMLRGHEPQILLDVPRPTPAQTMHHELDAFASQVASGTLDTRWRDVTLAARDIMDRRLAS